MLNGEQFFMVDKYQEKSPYGVIKVKADGCIEILYIRIRDYMERLVNDFFSFDEKEGILVNYGPALRDFQGLP